MVCELEPFGIKLEPEVTRINIANSMIASKKSQDPNSPYSQLMQNVTRKLEHMLEGGSSVELLQLKILV
jgi:hypothetical protein